MAYSPFTLPDYTDLQLPDPPPGRPYVLLNMVTSADGKIVIEGTEQGLGSAADQHLMRALRTNVDAVLNGASTLRQSGSSPEVSDPDLVAIRHARGLPTAPLGVVMTRSGDLPTDDRFFTSSAFESVVFTTDETPSERAEALRATGRPVEVVPQARAVEEMLRVLREQYAVRSLLCEGGAYLNGQLFDAGLVDECFLTVAPRIVGGDVALTPVRGDRAASFAATWPISLVSAVPNPETGEVYLRYRVASERGVTPKSS